MAWFILKDQPSRRKRVGIHLRVRQLTEDVLQKIKDSNCMEENDLINYIKILEVHPENKVLLEIWCYNPQDRIAGKLRSNVFHVEVDEDLEWICESDQGRGL